MKTIQMTIDDGLLKAMDKLSRARRSTRSAFIRHAVEAELRRERIHEQEVRHAQGYGRMPVSGTEFDDWMTEQDWGTP